MTKVGEVYNPRIVLLGLAIVMIVGGVDAQPENPFSVKVSASSILNDQWAADSTSFIYQDSTRGLSSWFRVDLNTQQLTMLNEYPITPPLSDTERQMFQIPDTFRASPDGNLLLFVSEGVETANTVEGQTRQYFYAVANRTTQEQITTMFRAPDNIGFGELANAQWSQDSQSYAIGTLSEAGRRRIDFMAIPDPNNLATVIGYTFEEEINVTQFYTSDPLINHLFDVADDGSRVLISAQEENLILDTNSEQTFFVLWSPAEPLQNTVLAIPDIDPLTVAAAFSPQDQDELYIWDFDDLGSLGGSLYRYNVSANQLYRLASLSPLYRPAFSPDGEWFSYFTQEDLVFLHLEELGQGEPTVDFTDMLLTPVPTGTETHIPTATTGLRP